MVAGMKELVELANRIKDKKLREKTIAILKDPKSSNPEVVWPAAKFDQIPAWAAGSHHQYEGGQAEHTVSVTRMCIMFAEHFESMYKIKINHDHLIAGALLHDIMKIHLYKRVGKNWQFTGSTLDHGFFSGAELYARGFPEEVVHIVAAHGGDMGAAGANPRTIEAILVHYADVFDSAIEQQIHGVPNMPLQLLLMAQPEEKTE
jgi:putative nucleotidyltransferase with HDIG domain